MIALVLLFLSVANTGVDTGFRPSIDMPVQRNAAGRGTAIVGQCNGIDEMSNAYFHWRKSYPNAQGLAAVTQQIETTRGTKYARGFVDLAMQNSYSVSRPRVDYSNSGDPVALMADVVDRLKKSGVPQSIVLRSPVSGIDHRVTVYGADPIKTPNGVRWSLRIADSNKVGLSGVNPDDVRLLFVPAAGGQPSRWSEQVGGRELTRYGEVGIIQSPIPKPSTYIDLVTYGLAGKPLGEVRAKLSISEIPPPTLGLAPGSVEVINDPQAGGVIVRFDPALFNGSVAEEELAALEQRVQAFLADGADRVAVFRLESRSFDLHLVSLEALMDASDTTLTRIRGFVRTAGGGVLIAGEREDGVPPIARDVLVVALRAIYGSGATPFVSLDPNPDAMNGPQRVRMGGLSGGLEQSQYALDLLDADYLMKRITLGSEVPVDEGFRSWVQLVAASGDESNSFHRLWLAPLTTPIGDLFEFRDAGGLAVLFDSHVQVKTEQMRAQMGQLVPGGGHDPVADEAAGVLTRRYDVLCEEYPEFRRLRGVFEASQLAAGLRAYGVQSPTLAALMKVEPRRVVVPDAYSGIGPLQIPGMRIGVSGGVEVPASYLSRTAVSTRALAPMLSMSAEVVVQIPQVITADAAATLGIEVESRFARAREAFDVGSFEEAAKRAKEVLVFDKSHAQAKALLAVSLATLNQNADALKVLAELGPTSPEARAMLAVLYSRQGDAVGVARESGAALAMGLVDDASLAAIATARLLVLDLKGASSAIDRLRAVAPTSPYVVPIRAQISDMQARSQADRERRAKLLRAVPPAVASALTHALTHVEAPDQSIGRLEDALALLQGHDVKVAPELAVPYRLRLALMMGYARRGGVQGPEGAAARVRTQALYAQAVKDQPTSGLPHLMRASIGEAYRETDAEVLKWLKLAGAGRMDLDPVYPDIRRLLGSDHLVSAMAMEMWSKRSTAKDPHYALLDFVLARQAGQPEAKLLKALRSADGAAMLADIRNGVNELGQAEKKKSLARFQRVEASVPRAMKGSEVTVHLAGRIYAYIAILQLQLSQRAGADQNLAKGVKLLRTAQVGPSARDQNAMLIGLMWVMSSGLATQDVMKNASLGMEMQALEKDLLQVLDGGVPVAAARRRLAAIEKRLVAALARMRSTVSASLAASEKTLGPMSRAAEELSLAITQDFLAGQNSPFRDGTTKYPELSATAEFKSLAAASDRAAQSMFVLGSIEGKWNALLAHCTSGTDYLACAALVSLTADLYQLPPDGLRRLLERYAMQARFKAGI